MDVGYLCEQTNLNFSMFDILVLGCKENGPLAHLLWILVFDDQHNQIGLMNLQSVYFVVQ